MQVIDTFRRYLGWCPYAQTRVQKAEVPIADEAVIPSGSGSFKDRILHWLGLFRNQTLLQTIGTFCIGLFLFAGLGGWSDLNLLVIGMLTGLPISAIFGVWYWRIFNEVLNCGPVVLWNRYGKTSWTIAVMTVVVSVCVWILVLLRAIPGVNLAMMNAFFGGFIAVLFWGMLVATQKWESDTHQRLHYDGMILELEKAGKNASR